MEHGSVDFGATSQLENILYLVPKIKTFTEGIDPKSSEITQIKDNMDEADRLVFVGFHFHELNMQLINPGNRDKRIKRECFATAYGISSSDQEAIKEDVNNLYPGRNTDVKISSSTCSKFFKEHEKGLSFQE